MYAEIKSNNKILINRLDDTEKILLKDILDNSKNKNIEFEQVISDDGEFGGIFINLEDKEDTNSESNSESNSETGIELIQG